MSDGEAIEFPRPTIIPDEPLSVSIDCGKEPGHRTCGLRAEDTATVVRYLYQRLVCLRTVNLKALYRAICHASNAQSASNWISVEYITKPWYSPRASFHGPSVWTSWGCRAIRLPRIFTPGVPETGHGPTTEEGIVAWPTAVTRGEN